MKKVILKNCDIKFNFHTEGGILHHSITSYKPKKEVGVVYGFWDNRYYARDLIEKLSENKKFMGNLRKLALMNLKDDRKQKYIELTQGQALTGKHIIKVTFEFENIKYEIKKIKKKTKKRK